MSGTVSAPASLATPPTPPGSLTVPPTASQVMAYLTAFDAWVTTLESSLDGLDAAAQQAQDPAAFTADVTLAMSLTQSITARRDELITAWDSGRVLADELARIAVLLWGRLPDPLGAPSAFTLPEACTLVAALNDRLATALAGDAIAGSGVAGRIDAVRAAIERCRAQAEVVGVPGTHYDELAQRLDQALASGDRARIADTVNAIDTETTIAERDLIKAAGLRTATARDAAAAAQQRTALEARSAAAAALAERCREKVTAPPRLAVPSVDALGPVPAIPAASSAPDDQWRAASAALEAYQERLDRCAAALAVAEQRYGAPLQQRDDLRGLVGAYRDRANRSGLAEDPSLGAAYDAVHEVLWAAPCDLDRAAALADAFQTAVRRAVGADAGPIIPATAPAPLPAPPAPTAGPAAPGGTTT